MRKRRITIVRRRSKWTVNEWLRGWELAMTRIEDAPSPVSTQSAFQECLAVLDGAFADGDRFRFELGLGTLMDSCDEAVKRGDCQRWWEK
jgi:hypothetical protein